MKYHSFDEKKVQEAIDTAKNHYNVIDTSDINSSQHGALLLAAECISVTVEDNKICISLPIGLGKACLPIPISVPNGTAASACLDICTTWGIPTGVKVTVKVAGVNVVSQSFGKC